MLTGQESSNRLRARLQAVSIIPVLAVRDVAHAVPLTEALVSGGLNPENAETYLKLPNVLYAGGSWIAPPEHLNSENWAAIASLAARASKLAC